MGKRNMVMGTLVIFLLLSSHLFIVETAWGSPGNPPDLEELAGTWNGTYHPSFEKVYQPWDGTYRHTTEEELPSFDTYFTIEVESGQAFFPDIKVGKDNSPLPLSYNENSGVIKGDYQRTWEEHSTQDDSLSTHNIIEVIEGIVTRENGALIFKGSRYSYFETWRESRLYGNQLSSSDEREYNFEMKKDGDVIASPEVNEDSHVESPISTIPDGEVTGPADGDTSIFGGVGKIPLPDNAAQAAAGILIPGLIAVGLDALGRRGTAGANIAAPGVSPHLSPGQEGYGDSSPEPAPDDFSDTPPPSRTMSLQGDKALEWLQERGLIEKADDGGYQFVDRDNVLNNFPGGRGGYVQGAQPDPNRVDDDIIIIFEPETPGPGQEEHPPYGDYEIPPEPGVEESSGEGPSDELPQEEGKELPDERVKKQEEGDTSPEDDLPHEEEREEEIDEREETGEPEEPEEPGEGEEPQEAEEPEEKIDEEGEEPPPQEDGGEEGKEPAPPSQGPEDKEVDPSREPRETDAPDAPPVSDPTRGERPLEETLGRGRDQAKETAEIAKEIEGYIKDSQGNIKDLQRATREAQGIIDELGVNPEDAGVIRDSLDRVNESLESINKGLESLQGICSSTKEYAEKVQEILERGGRIAEAYNNMYDRLPSYINDRARTGLSSYAAALQTAGEGVDKAFRSIPKVGDYLADALNTAELGGEMGEALYRGVENVTAADRRHYEEAIKPVTDRLMNDPHYTPSQEDLELSGLTPEQVQKAREQGARQREIQSMVEGENWKALEKHYPQEYEKYREDLEQRKLESFHPPQGDYEEPCLPTRIYIDFISVISRV